MVVILWNSCTGIVRRIYEYEYEYEFVRRKTRVAASSVGQLRIAFVFLTVKIHTHIICRYVQCNDT